MAKNNKKVTNIFEVISRLPDVEFKHSFIPPLFLLCGFIPFIIDGIVNKFFIVLTICIFILCPFIMLISLFEKEKKYKHIKMLMVFESELIVVLTITINLLIYYIFANLLINIAITLLFIALRIFKIYRLEKKIEERTYGYNMDGKVNLSIIGLASYIGARCGISANNATNPAIKSAYFLLILLLIGNVLLILFAVDPIVAFRIKLREKNKAVN